LQAAAFEKNAAGQQGFFYWHIIHISTAAVPEQKGL
jgi:hypothetical protein